MSTPGNIAEDKEQSQEEPQSFSIALSTSAPICHLSGTHKFAFDVTVTSHADYPITICLEKTPFRALHGVEDVVKVVDVETDEEPEWPYAIGCFEYDGTYFPPDSDFEEFLPGGSYHRSFALERYDEGSGNGGELEELVVGSVYKAKLAEAVLGSFGTWMRGTKGEVLKGTNEEKQARWDGGGGYMKSSKVKIKIEVITEEVRFETRA